LDRRGSVFSYGCLSSVVDALPYLIALTVWLERSPREGSQRGVLPPSRAWQERFSLVGGMAAR